MVDELAEEEIRILPPAQVIEDNDEDENVYTNEIDLKFPKHYIHDSASISTSNSNSTGSFHHMKSTPIEIVDKNYDSTEEEFKEFVVPKKKRVKREANTNTNNNNNNNNTNADLEGENDEEDNDSEEGEGREGEEGENGEDEYEEYLKRVDPPDALAVMYIQMIENDKAQLKQQPQQLNSQQQGPINLASPTPQHSFPPPPQQQQSYQSGQFSSNIPAYSGRVFLFQPNNPTIQQYQPPPQQSQYSFGQTAGFNQSFPNNSNSSHSMNHSSYFQSSAPFIPTFPSKSSPEIIDLSEIDTGKGKMPPSTIVASNPIAEDLEWKATISSLFNANEIEDEDSNNPNEIKQEQTNVEVEMTENQEVQENDVVRDVEENKEENEGKILEVSTESFIDHHESTHVTSTTPAAADRSINLLTPSPLLSASQKPSTHSFLRNDPPIKFSPSIIIQESSYPSLSNPDVSNPEEIIQNSLKRKRLPSSANEEGIEEMEEGKINGENVDENDL